MLGGLSTCTSSEFGNRHWFFSSVYLCNLRHSRFRLFLEACRSPSTFSGVVSYNLPLLSSFLLGMKGLNLRRWCRKYRLRLWVLELVIHKRCQRFVVQDVR